MMVVLESIDDFQKQEVWKNLDGAVVIFVSIAGRVGEVGVATKHVDEPRPGPRVAVLERRLKVAEGSRLSESRRSLARVYGENAIVLGRRALHGKVRRDGRLSGGSGRGDGGRGGDGDRRRQGGGAGLLPGARRRVVGLVRIVLDVVVLVVARDIDEGGLLALGVGAAGAAVSVGHASQDVLLALGAHSRRSGGAAHFQRALALIDSIAESLGVPLDGSELELDAHGSGLAVVLCDFCEYGISAGYLELASSWATEWASWVREVERGLGEEQEYACLAVKNECR